VHNKGPGCVPQNAKGNNLFTVGEGREVNVKNTSEKIDGELKRRTMGNGAQVRKGLFLCLCFQTDPFTEVGCDEKS